MGLMQLKGANNGPVIHNNTRAHRIGLFAVWPAYPDDVRHQQMLLHSASAESPRPLK